MASPWKRVHDQQICSELNSNRNMIVGKTQNKSGKTPITTCFKQMQMKGKIGLSLKTKVVDKSIQIWSKTNTRTVLHLKSL